MNPLSEFPQGNFPRSLAQPEITRQRHPELTDIEYDIINHKVAMMEWVEYNTSVGRNVMNIDDI